MGVEHLSSCSASDSAIFRWFVADNWIFVPMHSPTSDAGIPGGDQPMPAIGMLVAVLAVWVDVESSTAGSTLPEQEEVRRRYPWHAIEIEPYSVVT